MFVETNANPYHPAKPLLWIQHNGWWCQWNGKAYVRWRPVAAHEQAGAVQHHQQPAKVNGYARGQARPHYAHAQPPQQTREHQAVRNVKPHWEGDRYWDGQRWWIQQNGWWYYIYQNKAVPYAPVKNATNLRNEYLTNPHGTENTVNAPRTVTPPARTVTQPTPNPASSVTKTPTVAKAKQSDKKTAAVNSGDNEWTSYDQGAHPASRSQHAADEADFWWEIPEQLTRHVKQPAPPVAYVPAAGDARHDTYQPECLICMDNEPDVAFAPCGHILVCSKCLKKYHIELCPICRVKITRKIDAKEALLHERQGTLELLGITSNVVRWSRKMGSI